MGSIFLVVNKMADLLVSRLLQEMKNQQEPWHKMGQADQEARLMYLTNEVNSAVLEGVKQLFGANLPAVIVHLKSATITEDGVKATVIFGPEQQHALTDVIGTNVVLVLGDPGAHAADWQNFRNELDPDQGDLLAGAVEPEPDPLPDDAPPEGARDAE